MPVGPAIVASQAAASRRRVRARATTRRPVATSTCTLRAKRKSADSPPTVQSGASIDDLVIAKAPRKLSPASLPLPSPDTDMDDLALPTVAPAGAGAAPGGGVVAAAASAGADAAAGDFDAATLLCSETLADGAGCLDFEVSSNSAFSPRTALKSKQAAELEAAARAHTLQEERERQAHAHARKPHKRFEFPAPILPDRETLRQQRIASIRHRLNQCRTQQARGDFANDVTGAVRTLPIRWREKIVEWLQMIVIGRPALHAGTVAAGVSLLDAYMAKCRPEDVPSNADQYELCAVTAFVLACKYIERINVTTQIRRNFKQGRFTLADFARQEAKLLAVLDYRASPVTVHDVSRLLIDEFGHVATGAGRPDPANPAEAHCARQVTRLEGITNVMLDLQLSLPTTLGLPRAAVALGTVAAACEICNIDFDGLAAPVVHEVFEPAEVALHDRIRDQCQRHFCRTFPDLVLQRSARLSERAPSPQSVVHGPSTAPPHVLTAAPTYGVPTATAGPASL